MSYVSNGICMGGAAQLSPWPRRGAEGGRQQEWGHLVRDPEDVSLVWVRLVILGDKKIYKKEETG